MTLRIMGAVLVIVACGGYGFRLAAAYRRQERLLAELQRILEFMHSELECRMTSLPELCVLAAGQAVGSLKKVLLQLSAELDSQISPDVACCMEAAISRTPMLPPQVTDLLRRLGRSLGQFDLDGQLRQLKGVQKQCAICMEELRSHRDERVKSYEVLGVCAGIALAILLI